jgi:hypothetical protein
MKTLRILAALAAVAIAALAMTFASCSKGGDDDPKPVPVADGTDGPDISWVLYDNGTLEITGTGAMPDHDAVNAPWHEHREDIKKAVIADGVTAIGQYAFGECEALTAVTIPASVTKIGHHAFGKCNALATVTCLATVPPALGAGNFTANTDDVLYVPAASLSAYLYLHDAPWKAAFTNIEVIE